MLSALWNLPIAAGWAPVFVGTTQVCCHGSTVRVRPNAGMLVTVLQAIQQSDVPTSTADVLRWCV
jgi:hypothetical protein